MTVHFCISHYYVAVTVLLLHHCFADRIVGVQGLIDTKETTLVSRPEFGHHLSADVLRYYNSLDLTNASYGHPRNVSGTYKGVWEREALDPVLLAFGLTRGRTGVTVLQLSSSPGSSGAVHLLQGTLLLRFGDLITDDEVRLKLEGVYVPASGQLHLLAEPKSNIPAPASAQAAPWSSLRALALRVLGSSHSPLVQPHQSEHHLGAAVSGGASARHAANPAQGLKSDSKQQQGTDAGGRVGGARGLLSRMMPKDTTGSGASNMSSTANLHNPSGAGVSCEFRLQLSATLLSTIRAREGDAGLNSSSNGNSSIGGSKAHQPGGQPVLKLGTVRRAQGDTITAATRTMRQGGNSSDPLLLGSSWRVDPEIAASAMKRVRNATLPTSEGAWWLTDEAVLLEGAFFSPNCNVTLALSAASVPLDLYRSKATWYGLALALAALWQIRLIAAQMELTSSQSAAGKVSLFSVGHQALLDAYLCLIHLTTALFVGELLIPLGCISALQFTAFSVFGVRYVLLIWRAQRGGRDGSSWDLRSEFALLYCRFYGILLTGIVLIFQLRAYQPLLALLLFSFWLPQIAHAAITDSRPPLGVHYLLGTTASRLVLPAYLLGCPRNILHLPPNYPLLELLVAWQLLQVLALLVQMHFGPRCFVPAAFLPRKYDYHRPLTTREMRLLDSSTASSTAPTASCSTSSSSLAISHLHHVRNLFGGTSSDPSSHDHDAGNEAIHDVETGFGSGECVICMCLVPLVSASERMVSPCGHIFHTGCLIRWMDVKMECPTCRRRLPAV